MRSARRLFLAGCCCAALALTAAPAQASPTDPDYVRIVGNQASRQGVTPELIVLHVTTGPHGTKVVRDEPGIKDLEQLGAYFDDPQTEVSSHVANDADGNDARYVRDRRKAWTEVAFNSVGLSIEQIGSTASKRRNWLVNRLPQLEDTARWIAYWHRKWGIPIRRAVVSGGTVVEPGVATHKQLGRAGGNHSDPGPNYPFAYVLRLARTYAAPTAHGAP
jgi:N-acetylmuramoyl-L-alanine amidase-like protein